MEAYGVQNASGYQSPSLPKYQHNWKIKSVKPSRQLIAKESEGWKIIFIQLSNQDQVATHTKTTTTNTIWLVAKTTLPPGRVNVKVSQVFNVNDCYV